VKLDWLVYSLALGVVVFALFAGDKTIADAPPPPPEIFKEDGALLPAPSSLDDRILIQVNKPKSGIGTAFALDNGGRWLTARHVVDGCDDVGILIGPNTYVAAEDVMVDELRDLAIISTGRSPQANTLDLETPLKQGQQGFHVGYPQGRPGEAASRLLARSKLVSRGYRKGEEPVLAWAETGRTRGLNGSLGGLSGGPVFDEMGRVRGVVVAESPRRGRIYTAAPRAIAGFLEEQGVALQTAETAEFTSRTYGAEADRARRTLRVVKVACSIESGAGG